MTTEKVNLNTASREELVRIPYIGALLADRLIESRTKNGRLTDFEALRDYGFHRHAIYYLKENASL